MTNYDIVKKLIGDIRPDGDATTDDQKFKNLVETCKLIDKLKTDVSHVARMCRGSHENSVDMAGQYAYKFIDGITDNIIHR